MEKKCQEIRLLLLKRPFDWHKPSVVLLCIVLLVYLPEPHKHCQEEETEKKQSGKAVSRQQADTK